MLAEFNYLVLFDPVYKIGLADPDQTVKKTAIRALWECDDKDVCLNLIEILNNENEEVLVLAQAAAGLGKFVYLGEIEEIPKKLYQQIIDILLNKSKADQPELVRQRAIEALGFSSSPRVPALIEEAYAQSSEDWIINALVAMGRSGHKQWIPMITESLAHEESKIRLEAAQAAGEIAGQGIVPHMLHLLDDPVEDVRQAAIWSLSEIGGDDAKLALEKALMRAMDEEEIAFLEEALDNLDFNEMAFGFELFDLSEEDLEDMIDDEPEEED
jgi:HEAT repeat protein